MKPVENLKKIKFTLNGKARHTKEALGDNW